MCIRDSDRKTISVKLLRVCSNIYSPVRHTSMEEKRIRRIFSMFPCVSVSNSVLVRHSNSVSFFAIATIMTVVRPSVTLVNFDHTVQQRVEIGIWQDRSVCVSAVYVISCNPWNRKCGVLYFGGIQRLACRAISASAELLVLR